MTSNNDALAKRVEAVLDMALSTVASLDESFTSVSSLLDEDGAPAEDKKTPEAIAEPVPESAQPADDQQEEASASEHAEVKQDESDSEERTKTVEIAEDTAPVVPTEQDEKPLGTETADVPTAPAVQPRKVHEGGDGKDSEGSSDGEDLHVHG